MTSILSSRKYNAYLLLVCSLGVLEDELGCPLQVSMHTQKYSADCKLINKEPLKCVVSDIKQNHASKTKIRQFFHLQTEEINGMMRGQEDNLRYIKNEIGKDLDEPEQIYLESRNSKSYVEDMLMSVRGVQ